MTCHTSLVSHGRTTRGMTLVEFLCFVILLLCAICGAGLGHHLAGRWYGYLVGGILGAVAFLTCLAALAALLTLWFGGGLPKCRNGCCRGPGLFSGYGDYDIQQLDGKSCEVCKCGDRYRRHGRRFVIVNEDGTETPYLIWRRFRGWRPDVPKA